MCWLDSVPAVFDFDDCAHYWFAADVAYALRDLYEDRIERIDLADRRLRAFAEGYVTHDGGQHWRTIPMAITYLQ